MASNNKREVIDNLMACGITYDDACGLRKIAMTLHSWFELECGTDAGCIERDEKTNVPYLCRDVQCYDGKWIRTRAKVGDRESGALARLRIIMREYPTLEYYIQGDPRGASLYIIRPGDIPDGERADAYYTRGVAVYK